MHFDSVLLDYVNLMEDDNPLTLDPQLHSSHLKPNSMAVLTTLGNVAYAKAQCRDFSGALKVRLKRVC